MSPIRVDFYLLDTASQEALEVFACRLLEKAYLRKNRIFVYCRDKAQAESLDERLWTFKEDSFIPHNLQGEGPRQPPAIQLGFAAPSPDFHDILLNLADEIPVFHTRFKRVIELVANEEGAKQLSRVHYKTYRQGNCELQCHTIAVTAPSS